MISGISSVIKQHKEKKKKKIILKVKKRKKKSYAVANPANKEQTPTSAYLSTICHFKALYSNDQ